jgi:hypothetical protein
MLTDTVYFTVSTAAEVKTGKQCGKYIFIVTEVMFGSSMLAGLAAGRTHR